MILLLLDTGLRLPDVSIEDMVCGQAGSPPSVALYQLPPTPKLPVEILYQLPFQKA